MATTAQELELKIDREEIDAFETEEWCDAIDAVLANDGVERAHYLIEKVLERVRRKGSHLPVKLTTAYRNTIPVHEEPIMPGDAEMERRIRAIIRWNALAIVLRGSKKDLELGGHISSFASAATLYDVGFNHFFKGDSGNGGDMVFIQGHSSPGIYARAFLEGRLDEAALDMFRQEVGENGLSSYPHPYLMPDFWQFPTVSMGLGPLQAIAQARFMKYLEHRGLAETSERKVWAYMGDGETDEPESLGMISLAGREKLDNLIFVINCNLQRLDGPVRGNGKIIQELESAFRGAGWHVIKVVWGRGWDPLFAKDTDGVMQDVMEKTVDGEYQNFKAKGGAYTRENFFGKHPDLKAMVAHLSDEDIWHLNRGGHDPQKVYAAYNQATNHKGQPVVILAKTVKGYGMGASGEGKNISHQVKKMNLDAIKHFRDRFQVPVSDADLENVPLYKPAPDSPEIKYLQATRERLGGYLPERRAKSESLEIPPLETFKPLLEGSGEREISTTMAFVRLINILLKDKTLGPRVVPIIPDEARTFGMEGMFRQYGIYSSVGQLYEPVDSDQIMYYREDQKGQILEEGINEAGAFSSWIAAATSYANHNYPMIPFYIFYSMFGFQRVGDLAWSAGDSQARGFLLGATAGRTTLNGEGLQHQDGHSHLMAAMIPNCKSYDPTYAHEVAVIMRHGMHEMLTEQKNVFYYLTLMNENYPQPAVEKLDEAGIIQGMYCLEHIKPKKVKAKAHLLGSGTILREVEKAAAYLADKHDIEVKVWSVTSFNELRREGLEVVRNNRLNPADKPNITYVEKCLGDDVPVIAATDYMKSYADGIREFVKAPYDVLGTDGFGRSDSRENLRAFFEVNEAHVITATLSLLSRTGKVDAKTVSAAMKKFGIDAKKPDPTTV